MLQSMLMHLQAAVKSNATEHARSLLQSTMVRQTSCSRPMRLLKSVVPSKDNLGVGLASVVSGQLATGVMDASSTTKKTGCGDEPYARDARQLTASALIAQDLQLLLVHSWSCED